MSHKRSREEILNLKKYLNDLEDANIDVYVLYNILHDIIPKSENGTDLVGIIVKENGNTPAAYIPRNNTIIISKNGFSNVVDSSAEAIGQATGIHEISRLKTYYRLFALLHEVEHGYQFMIARDKIPFKYSEVKEGYKNIINRLSKGSYILPRPITEIKHTIAYFKYQKNAYDYVLERNASIEAARDICQIADSNNETDIKDAFDILKSSMEYIGYEDDTKGCMYKTHKELLLSKEYNRIHRDVFYDIERKRFGPEIDEDTRNELLKKYRFI